MNTENGFGDDSYMNSRGQTTISVILLGIGILTGASRTRGKDIF